MDQALAWVEEARQRGEAVSIGLAGNAADVHVELLRRGFRPDVVTDQTSAHDLVNGYLPAGWTVAEWIDRRQSDPASVEEAARASIKVHVQAMLETHIEA